MPQGPLKSNYQTVLISNTHYHKSQIREICTLSTTFFPERTISQLNHKLKSRNRSFFHDNSFSYIRISNHNLRPCSSWNQNWNHLLKRQKNNKNLHSIKKDLSLISSIMSTNSSIKNINPWQRSISLEEDSRNSLKKTWTKRENNWSAKIKFYKKRSTNKWKPTRRKIRPNKL